MAWSGGRKGKGQVRGRPRRSRRGKFQSLQIRNREISTNTFYQKMRWQAKKKQKRKVSKPANKKQGNINQYFLPENEVAGIEAGVDIEKADLHERQLGISSPLIIGRCPMCSKGFAEVSQLTVHASECQDSA